jgi:hypothetical protein
MTLYIVGAHAYQLGRKQRISIVAETIWPEKDICRGANAPFACRRPRSKLRRFLVMVVSARSGEGTGVTSEVGWADVAGVALARA